jgi:MFS family permease
MFFIGSMVILSLGYQLHFAINSAPFFLRFAKPDELPWLMPVFWIGFNLLMWPASLWVQRSGGVVVMATGSLVGAAASAVAALAGSMPMLVAAQFVAGGAWGAVLMSAVAACIALGHTGREGAMTGSLFSLLALATFARMGLVAAQFNKDPQFAAMLAWAPSAAWLLAAVVLLLLWRRAPRPA